MAAGEPGHLATMIPCSVEHGGAIVSGALSEVSVVGARVALTEPVTWSDRAQVTLQVDASSAQPALEVRARVAYLRQRGEQTVAALQFVDLDAETYRDVRAFVGALVDGEGGGRRRQPRVHHRHQITVASKREIRAYLQNISAGGLAITVDSPVSVGDPITVSLRVSNLRPLELPGRVVRAQTAGSEHEVGIALGELSPPTSAMLRKLMRALLDVDS